MLCLTLAKLSEAVILTFLCSLATACLAWFIQYTLKPGEIFGRYGLWLNYHWIHGRPHTVRAGEKKIRKRRKFWTWFLKPAGLCVFCSSVWSGSAFYAVACYLWQIQLLTALFVWPLFVGVQYVWVKLLGRVADE